MKKILILCFFLLAGCSHAEPVTVAFPDAPSTLQERCGQLKEATQGMTLSDFTRTVVENYILYHECARKVEGWNEWYARQRAIFEQANQ